MIKKMVPMTVYGYCDYEDRDMLVHTDSTLLLNGLDKNGPATTEKQVSLLLSATDS